MNYDNDFSPEKFFINALKEDIGARDITTDFLIPKQKLIKGIILAKQDLVVCGLTVALSIFKTMDKNIEFKAKVRDGDVVKKGKILAKVKGSARGILTAERVALNFLSLLCGISTKTREFVDLVKPYNVKIIDTRKTLPGLRILEKYAVRIGGGFNHRMSLDEMVLVKDNHIKVIGDRLWVIGSKGIKNKIPSQARIEIEVKNLKEFKKALKLKPDIIMLDNMNNKDIRAAVKMRNKLEPSTYNLKPKLEASGGTTLKNVKQIASTGVDMISIGSLTHSINSVDISLEII